VKLRAGKIREILASIKLRPWAPIFSKYQRVLIFPLPDIPAGNIKLFKTQSKTKSLRQKRKK
jgi:hypothetical protein